MVKNQVVNLIPNFFLLVIILSSQLQMENVNSFLIYSFQGGNIMDEYDRRSFYLMFLKCYHPFHPIIKFVGCVDQTIHENYNLYIFQQIASPSEPMKEFVTKKLLMFKHYQVDSKDIKCPFQWWAKHEVVSLIACVLAHKF